jgi:hypothetical protein
LIALVGRRPSRASALTILIWIWAPDGQHALLNLAGGKIDLIDLQSGTRKLMAQGGFPIWSATV